MSELDILWKLLFILQSAYSTRESAQTPNSIIRGHALTFQCAVQDILYNKIYILKNKKGISEATFYKGPWTNIGIPFVYRLWLGTAVGYL